MSTPPFTALVALWAGDEAQHARAALSSLTLEQELRPQSIVIAVDGPLPPELDAVVSDAEAGQWGPAAIERARTHIGLAQVLERGLALCPTEIVARADADDLNRPERFARQIPAMEAQGLDLLGSAMAEIGSGKLRTRPTERREIELYARDHNPFQHPTVVFRKSAVEAAGGYRDLPFMEDWYLWYRMIRGGARSANLPEPLVDYRVTEALYRRRGGLRPLQSDIILQRTMIRDGATSRVRAARNIAARAAYRSVGPRARAIMYRALIERRTESSSM